MSRRTRLAVALVALVAGSYLGCGLIDRSEFGNSTATGGSATRSYPMAIKPASQAVLGSLQPEVVMVSIDYDYPIESAAKAGPNAVPIQLDANHQPLPITEAQMENLVPDSVSISAVRVKDKQPVRISLTHQRIGKGTVVTVEVDGEGGHDLAKVLLDRTADRAAHPSSSTARKPLDGLEPAKTEGPAAPIPPAIP